MGFIGQRASFLLTALWLQHDLFLLDIPCKLLEDDQVKVGLFRPCVAELYVLSRQFRRQRPSKSLPQLARQELKSVGSELAVSLDARLASGERYDDTLRTDHIGQVRSCPLAPLNSPSIDSETIVGRNNRHQPCRAKHRPHPRLHPQPLERLLWELDGVSMYLQLHSKDSLRRALHLHLEFLEWPIARQLRRWHFLDCSIHSALRNLQRHSMAKAQHLHPLDLRPFFEVKYEALGVDVTTLSIQFRGGAAVGVSIGF